MYIVTEDFCPRVCHHKLKCNCSKLFVIHYWQLLGGWGLGWEWGCFMTITSANMVCVMF